MNYLLWINIYLIIFYGFYWIFLRNTTFFQIKRFYLLLAAVLSFILPLLTFDQTADVQSSIALAAETIGQQMNQATVIQQSTSTWDMITLLYIIGLISSLLWLTGRSIITYNLLKAKTNQIAFSFFNQVVIDPQIEGYDRILIHERTHANELHSIDLLLFEIIKIVNWFNPISYLMTKSVKLNHEYIADQKSVSSSEDRIEYAHLLVSKVLATNSHTLTNNFFNKSVLKPRITMLFKNKSRKSILASFALLIPVLALMVACQSSTKDDATEKTTIGLSYDPNDSTQSITEIQGKTTDSVDNLLFTAVETPPSFNGGMEKFYQFISDNYIFPEEAEKNKVEGRVLLQFIVEKDGSLSDINILRDLKYGTGEEAVRVLKNSPKWKPGIQNGQPVRVQFTLPIQLDLSKGSPVTQSTRES